MDHYTRDDFRWGASKIKFAVEIRPSPQLKSDPLGIETRLGSPSKSDPLSRGSGRIWGEDRVGFGERIGSDLGKGSGRIWGEDRVGIGERIGSDFGERIGSEFGARICTFLVPSDQRQVWRSHFGKKWGKFDFVTKLLLNCYYKLQFWRSRFGTHFFGKKNNI